MMRSPTEGRNDQGIGVAIRYTKLTIDDLNLLIPEQEINALESVQLVATETEESFDNSIGVLDYQGEARPVYCFTDELMLTQVVPSNRRVCVVVNAKNAFYSIVCDRIALLEDSQVKLHLLPDCMSTEESPIHSVTVHDNGIACIVSSDSLFDLIQRSSLVGHDQTLANAL